MGFGWNQFDFVQAKKRQFDGSVTLFSMFYSQSQLMNILCHPTGQVFPSWLRIASALPRMEVELFWAEILQFTLIMTPLYTIVKALQTCNQKFYINFIWFIVYSFWMFLDLLEDLHQSTILPYSGDNPGVVSTVDSLVAVSYSIFRFCWSPNL